MTSHALGSLADRIVRLFSVCSFHLTAHDSRVRGMELCDSWRVCSAHLQRRHAHNCSECCHDLFAQRAHIAQVHIPLQHLHTHPLLSVTARLGICRSTLSQAAAKSVVYPRYSFCGPQEPSCRQDYITDNPGWSVYRIPNRIGPWFLLRPEASAPLKWRHQQGTYMNSQGTTQALSIIIGGL